MIRILQPAEHEIVGEVIQIGGTAGEAFEATFVYRISEGHDEVSDSFLSGTGTGGIGQFSLEVDLSGAAFTLTRVFVTVESESPKDGSIVESDMVSCYYGPLALPGYVAWRRHEVVSGDTLSGIADNYYGDSSKWPVIHQVNQHQVPDPDLIYPGQVLQIPVTG